MEKLKQIEFTDTIRPYLGRIDALPMPTSYKEMLLAQYRTLDTLSRDKHDYGAVTPIMEHRFKCEAEIFQMLLEKLVPGLSDLNNTLRKKLQKKWWEL